MLPQGSATESSSARKCNSVYVGSLRIKGSGTSSSTRLRLHLSDCRSPRTVKKVFLASKNKPQTNIPAVPILVIKDVQSRNQSILSTNHTENMDRGSLNRFLSSDHESYCKVIDKSPINQNTGFYESFSHKCTNKARLASADNDQSSLIDDQDEERSHLGNIVNVHPVSMETRECQAQCGGATSR